MNLGMLVATRIVSADGNDWHAVELWFASPTGDSTDTVITTLPCHSFEHAVEVNNFHRQVWALDQVNTTEKVVVSQ